MVTLLVVLAMLIGVAAQLKSRSIGVRRFQKISGRAVVACAFLGSTTVIAMGLVGTNAGATVLPASMEQVNGATGSRRERPIFETRFWLGSGAVWLRHSRVVARFPSRHGSPRSSAGYTYDNRCIGVSDQG